MQPSFEKQLSYIISRQHEIVDAWHETCLQDSQFSHLVNHFNLQFIMGELVARLTQLPSKAPITSSLVMKSLIPPEKRSINTCQSFIRQLHHLQKVIMRELESYASSQSSEETNQRWEFRQTVMTLIEEWIEETLQVCAETMTQNSSNFFNQSTLTDEQIGILRAFIHDTRGNLGAISGASVLLGTADISESQRQIFNEVLQRNVKEIQLVLNELFEFCNVGKKPLHLSSTNVAQVIKEVVAEVQVNKPTLAIHTYGPDSLLAVTDVEKLSTILHRTLQFILLQMPKGSVSISYASAIEENSWTLNIQFSESVISFDNREKILSKMGDTFEFTANLSSRQKLSLYMVRILSTLLNARLAIEDKKWIYIKFPLSIIGGS
ncbi:hypothetical protein [Siphonobacter sp. SORGH_AS_1065]|uniref:hypothetical protein n=1 Tax=Siphonobacter sp. SORGH_AS_1065 TaxID=3041795 RepID=UPI002786EF7D|nr:hypothetical protein [Siphonobacter sp. SORGH_AS_1065]MDQ1090281.1 signal transduction histidine kinase [Siphonobacter sp. SORGH_AS_1065]